MSLQSSFNLSNSLTDSRQFGGVTCGNYLLATKFMQNADRTRELTHEEIMIGPQTFDDCLRLTT